MNVKENLKEIRWYLIFGFLGYFIFFLIFPRLDDFSNINITLNREQVNQKIEEWAAIFDADLDGLEPEISFWRNNDLIKYSQKRFGLIQTSDFMDNNFPAYFWNVEYTSPESERDTSESMNITIGGDRDRASVLGRRRQRSIVFQIASNGQLISYEKIFPPDTSNQNRFRKIKADDAFKYLQQFSPEGITDWQLKSHNTVNRRVAVNRFRWITHQVEWADSLEANIDFRGGELRRFNLSMDLSRVQRVQSGDNIYGILVVVGMLVLSVLILISFIKRLRQDKIDFKYARIIAIITGIATIFTQIPGFSSDGILEFFLYSLLLAPFFGSLAFVLVSVTESAVRDVWNEKLYNLDYLIRARIHSPRLGLALMKGLVFGGVILAVIALLIFFMDKAGSIWIQHEDGQVEKYVSPFVVFYNIGNDWTKAIFTLFAFGLFLSSQLRPLIRNNIFFLLAFSLVFALVPLEIVKIGPFYFLLFVNFCIGFMLLWTFLRFDFVVAGIAFISVISFIAATPFLNQDSVLYIVYGVLSLAIPGIFLIIGLIGISSIEDPEIETEYVPPYLKRYRERERLHRELEIARTVQLKFLPQSKPDVKWLDVASICIPAYEIGGDYYDFVQLDDSRFGVIVGDVSGKGVSAAFYMTLMKGIFKSQTRHVQSPCDVLKQINDLFYENTQRGVFISMIYGVFDQKKATFTFARAGHNPLISLHQKKNQADQLSPYGIAIGLDKGPIFDDTLEESEVKFEPGDIFVFYTDGYSEAMNKNRSEFGEERLVEIVNRNSNSPAQTVLDKIQIEVDKFTGDSLQHDDMTMVVVRIRGKS